MNNEQNKAGTVSENDGAAGEGTSTTHDTSQSTTTTDVNASGTPNSKYYAVDHATKDVISTIGDGEMHNEGLVGAGEATTDIQTSMERLTEEQDIAESHDSEQ